MQQTKRIYMKHMDQYSCDALVLEVIEQEGQHSVILDQTVFYPQGGGQPYDLGTITSHGKLFTVLEVRLIEEVVYHIGKFEAEIFNIGENVSCQVDIDRRILNSKLHSAGHVVDMTIKQLGINWIPNKGYHFPNGPYIEYTVSDADVNLEKLKSDFETACNNVLNQSIETSISFLNGGDEKNRIVTYGDFNIPCGGTHVRNLNDIGKIVIRKIKKEGNNIKVSYMIESKIT